MSTIILAAGSGGHLMQLKMFHDAGHFTGNEVVWVTDRTPQSESLLRGQRVCFLPHRAPRDVRGVVTNAWLARKLFTRNVTGVYSTGAGIALSMYLPAVLNRASFNYTESATRVTGLSLTGRVVNYLPFAKRRVQHRQLANRRWTFEGSVFDALPVRESALRGVQPRKVFISLGANQHAGFRPLVERIISIAPPEAELFFQYGPTAMDGLKVDGAPDLSWEEVLSRSRDADVVVTHAGTGSLLTSLLAGKIPVLIPRSAAAGEHVDEHQNDLAEYARDRGLAIVSQVADLTWDHLVDASNRTMGINND